ncbi:MAG: hypothetical protein P0S95_00840 [Rhabdochlamydiaceae bacterium]|nr:hypothetical protein [Candidatus Amphrikana amoebophyrae]
MRFPQVPADPPAASAPPFNWSVHPHIIKPDGAPVDGVIVNLTDVNCEPSRSGYDLVNCALKAIIGVGLLYYRILPQSIRYPLAALSILLAVRDGINYMGPPKVREQKVIPVGKPVTHSTHGTSHQRYRVVTTRDWFDLTVLAAGVLTLAGMLSNSVEPPVHRRSQQFHEGGDGGFGGGGSSMRPARPRSTPPVRGRGRSPSHSSRSWSPPRDEDRRSPTPIRGHVGSDGFDGATPYDYGSRRRKSPPRSRSPER